LNSKSSSKPEHTLLGRFGCQQKEPMKTTYSPAEFMPLLEGWGYRASYHRDRYFGNARAARNILQAMKRKLAIRVTEEKLFDRESLMTFIPEDIEKPKQDGRRHQIGFSPRATEK